MPIIRASFLAGRTDAQKADLARLLTQAVVDALGAPPETVRVLLTEMSPDDWYSGGRSMRERAAR